MAPIENAAGHRYGHEPDIFELYLQKIAESYERKKIENIPAGGTILQIYPDNIEKKYLAFCLSGGIIIPLYLQLLDFLAADPDDNPATCLGPYTTHTIEREDSVLKKLGCQEIAFEGNNKKCLRMTIEGRVVKIFLGRTRFSQGNRLLDQENQNSRLTDEATAAIAALSITPKSLLPFALEQGILIANRLGNQPPLFLPQAMLLPATHLGTKTEKPSDYLLPIPLNMPHPHFENLNKIKTLLELDNPNHLKPVVICWQNRLDSTLR